MTNLTQAGMQVTIPKAVLNDIPEDSISVRNTAELFAKVIQPDELREYIFLSAKAYFIPLILTTMIERDSTFKDAVNYSREKFGSLYDRAKEMFEDPSTREVIINMVKDSFDIFKDIPKETNFLDKDKETIALGLQNITAEMNDTLERTRILSSARMIAEDFVIRSTIKKCRVDPICQAIDKVIQDFSKKVEMEEEDFTDFVEEFKKGIELEYLLMPLGIIVSEVLTNAIKKNIRFSEAIDSITTNMYNKIIEETEKAADLNKKTAAYEKTIMLVFNAIYAIVNDEN